MFVHLFVESDRNMKGEGERGMLERGDEKKGEREAVNQAGG